MSEPFCVKPHQMELHELLLCVQQALNRRDVDDLFHNAHLSLSRTVEPMAGNLIYQLTSRIYTHNLQRLTLPVANVLEVSYPADWWQHFKERCFPAWLKKHWPVRTKTVKKEYQGAREIDLKLYFPDLAFPAKERTVILTWINETLGNERTSERILE